MAGFKEMPTVQLRNPEVHVRARQGIASASTFQFLTVFVFVFITGTITPSSTVPTNCVAGEDIAGIFSLFKVLSFVFCLLCSLAEQGMKFSVTVHDFYVAGEQEPVMTDEMPAWRAKGPREPPRDVLRYAEHMMLLASACSVVGLFFLLLSMICAIQLKFGILSCNIPIAVGTFVFSALAGGGLIFYGRIVAYAVINYLRRP